MTTEEMDGLMHIVGRRLATKWNVPPGDLHARLEMAVEILNVLGGLAELEERDGTYSIRGYSCPLLAAVPGHPQVCHLAETLLTELVGVPIQEHCDRHSPPRCCFDVVNS